LFSKIKSSKTRINQLDKGNITRRLVVSFSLLIPIYFLYGLYSLYDIHIISGLTRTIYNHPLVVSNAALQANVSITKMHRDIKDVVLFTSPTRIQQAVTDVGRQERLVDQYLDMVRDNILGDEGKQLEKETRTLFDDWRPMREEVIDLVRRGQRDAAAEITIGKGAEHVNKLDEKMNALTNYARTKAAAFMKKAEKSHSRLNVSLVLFLVSAVSLSSLIAVITLKRTAFTEKELWESRQLFVNAIDYAPIGMVLVEPEGKYYKTNKAFSELTGYSEKELLKMNYQEITHPDDYPIGLNAVRQLIEGKIEKASLEKRYLNKDGNVIDVYLTISLLRSSGGSPLYLFAQVQDITARKLAEQRVEHLNRVLRAIRDVNQLIVRERDPQTLIREACRLLVDNRGYTSALIVIVDKNGRLNSWAGSGVASYSGSLSGMLERGELPPCYNIARSSKEVISINDRSGVCDECPIVGECTGTPSLCVRLAHENTNFGYIVAAPSHDMSVDDEECSLFLEMAGDIAYALNFNRMEADRELSERKRETLEHQLLQAQKMESIGRLAGGVAHDYNNMLSVIIGYTELAMEKTQPEEPLHGDLQEVLAAAMRSTEITKQLLAFARQQTVAPEVLDLNAIVEGMLNMLRRLIGEDLDFSWQPEKKVWPVKIDPSQINQILANLCVNARDAIKDVGKVTIETRNASFDEDYCADHAGFIPGDYVMLAVSDNGSGMAPETLDKAFEPFFTTKGIGQGTGLGLATVYGIVKQNNGFINIYSEPEQGTTIKTYLPRHSGVPVRMDREGPAHIPLSQGETVLLVEDDGSILKLAQTILEKLGYTVLPAASPSEAKNLAAEHAGDIDLLITDVVMPEMNGRELSEHLHALYPELETLYMSGYTANVIAHRGVLDEGVAFIPKPLSIKELAAKVRKVLDKSPA
jgi:two-component system, cell cycle sensor histidine kinase and response regulator CckA